MRTDELCTVDEYERGYSAHYTGFGIMIYHNSKPWMQVSTETELHDILGDWDTIGIQI